MSCISSYTSHFLYANLLVHTQRFFPSLVLVFNQCGCLRYVPVNFRVLTPQELEVRSLYHLYSLKTKSSQCHYVVMTRSETELSVAIPAPVSGQSAVNVATATSKCSITFLLPYDQDGDVKTKQDNVSNIL